MLNDLKLLDTMSAMTRHAAQRHAVIAENIANADTPGYTAKDITPFQDIYKKALQDNSAVPMETVKVISAPNELSMSPNGNSVSLEQQMMLSTEVKATHDMALAIYKKSLEMMRMTVGKNL